MTFQEQLILTIVDKLAIGLIVLFAGFWINRQLERFKSRQSLFLEITREKRELVSKQLNEFYWPILLRLEKDNTIWRHMLGRHKKDQILQKFGAEFEKSFILPNHEEILKIIETHADHLGNDQELLMEVNKYTRHISVYLALRATGDIRDPYVFDKELGWPENFYPLIHKKTMELQQEYEQLMKID